MGLLGDVYSYGDGLKRKLRGLLDDPMGTLELGVTRFGEDQRGLLNLQENAYPMPGNRTVLNSPQQINSFRRELGDKAAEQAMAAATVWHGSPHKFDKFDSSKIGTGEGAQAYGHGLYLAEQKAVADEYAGKLSKPIVDFFGKVPSDPVEISIQQKLQSLAETTQTGSKLDEISKAFDSYLNPSLTRWNPKHPKANAYNGMAPLEGEQLEQIIALRDAAKRLGRPDLGDSGSLYKVDLPDEHIAKMLDYDNPIPEAMRKPLSSAALEQFGSGLTGTSGEKLYKEMIFNFKQAGHTNPTQAATDWLTQQGVPGMRYLDGGSRSSGAGSSNYVIFPKNEGLLQILERNGAPMK